MIGVHPEMSAVVAHGGGHIHFIGLEPAEMRALAADLLRRADEIEAAAADAADAALARAGGRQ